MKWKTTWLLLGMAATLFAFIILVERRIPDGTTPPRPLLAFKANEVTNIWLRLTNQLVLRVERAGPEAPWILTDPLSYPGHPHAIELLIRSLEVAVPHTEISQRELKASKRSVAEFGLDVPQATLTLQHNGHRTEVFYGSKTPVGDGVYVKVLNQPDIYVVSAELADRLPRSHNDWRDTSLLATSGFQWNRLEVRSGGRGFTVELDPTNQVFVLTKPTIARAERAKVEALLRKLVGAQTVKFVTDNPRADLETYGLQLPETELTFLVGSNEQFTAQFVVQFGKSPTNDPAHVYARRLAQTNIVLVPRSVLEAVQISHSDLRDLHLLSFAPNAVDAIEVVGDESFVLRRQTNGTWMIADPRIESADTNSVGEWLEVLGRLEGAVEKDVVTDFSTPYGLSQPARKYLLKASGTNIAGAVSNRVIAQLDLGNVQDKKVFARRPDEATVYSLSLADVAKLPKEAWQLRDRKVWNFTTNQIHRVTIRHHGQTRTLQRSGSGSWSIVEGEGIVPSNNAALEATMHRLGELRADIWVAKGAEKRPFYGFSDSTDKIAIELKNGDKPQVLVLEFGQPGRSPNQIPYALAVAEGQTWIFECPVILWLEVVRDLFNPMSILRAGE
jgi:hypothetical protein